MTESPGGGKMHHHQADSSAHDPDAAKTLEELRRENAIQRQIAALGTVLQTVDRIMSNQNVKVVTQQSSSWPAWTDGTTIFLNKDDTERVFRRSKLTDAIMEFKGRNYHELAHVLFSPRVQDVLGRWLNQSWYKYRLVYNVLEDQRIETMYTTLYSATSPYFTMAASKWLLFDVNEYGKAYPWIAGRLYLPRSLRVVSRQMFVAEFGLAVADELDRIIKSYIQLPLPHKTPEAQQLIMDFHKLVEDHPGLLGQSELVCGTQGQNMHQGTVSADDVIEASERVTGSVLDDYHQDDDDDLDADLAGDSGDADLDAEGLSGIGEAGDAGESSSGGSSGESEEGPGGGELDGESGGKSPDVPLDRDGAGGQSHGGSMEGSDQPFSDQDKLLDQKREDQMREELEDALADALNDPELTKDLKRTTESFHAQMDRQMMEGDSYSRYGTASVTTPMVRTVEKITDVLRMLHTDLEPERLRDQQSGRLNLNRVIRHAVDPTFTDIYDQWYEGNEDDATCEVVVALDLSGSMAHQIDSCSQALWTLKRAFERLEIPVTVVGFSDGHVSLYKRGERVHPNQYRRFHSWNGTYALDTMKVAHRILSSSDATNRIFVAITDGAWEVPLADSLTSDLVVSSMRRAGMETMLVCLNGSFTEGTHNFETVLEATRVEDMVAAVQKLVASITRRAGTR